MLNPQVWSRRILFIVVSLLTLTIYQNCAAPSESTMFGSETYTADGCPTSEPNCLDSAEGDPTSQSTGNVEMWLNLYPGNTLSVVFPSTVLEVRGECYLPMGMKSDIKWILYKPNSNEIREQGLVPDSACDQGRFAFDIALINTYTDPFDYTSNHKFTVELTARDVSGNVFQNSVLAKDDAWVNGGQSADPL
ncbi:MAG: hypothetical protein AB7O96_06805 [Pseudobdellovibrionaceae bacterium]